MKRGVNAARSRCAVLEEDARNLVDREVSVLADERGRQRDRPRVLVLVQQQIVDGRADADHRERHRGEHGVGVDAAVVEDEVREVVQRPVHRAPDVQPEHPGRRLVEEDLLRSVGMREPSVVHPRALRIDLRPGDRRPECRSARTACRQEARLARRSSRARSRRRSRQTSRSGSVASCRTDTVSPKSGATSTSSACRRSSRRGYAVSVRRAPAKAARVTAPARPISAAMASRPTTLAAEEVGRAEPHRSHAASLRRPRTLPARWLAVRPGWCHHPAPTSSS